MILVTGGLGFIGSHTTRALLDLGESCVVVSRRDVGVPERLAEPDGRVVVEQADITDRAGFLDVGRRHPITGIVHLAGAFGTHGPVEDARRETGGLLTVLEAAQEWGVPRVGFASTIGVYGGAAGRSPYREDALLPMTSGHIIPAFKKIDELLCDHVGANTGIEVVSLRISAAWGPLGRTPSRFFAAPQLVHAAVHGEQPSPVYADDGIDMCYVKDVGRAIALLQLADQLDYRTYNVAAGRPTTNGDVVAALGKAVPAARIDLLAGRDPNGPVEPFYLDNTRLRKDTGFEPAYDTERGVADYVAWLRAGHER
jgi:UDP-glucose 4-epimerase